MALKLFKCYICSSLPENDVFICTNKHIQCVHCAKKSKNLCRCKSQLKPSSNLLEVALLNVCVNCDYKEAGCVWKCEVQEMQDHLKECKYRPDVCLGDKLNLWQCSWKGSNNNIVQHLQEAHSFKKTYSYSEEDKILFKKDNDKIFTTINLIDAFEKSFIFYYVSDFNANTVSIIIFLLGLKQTAKKYLYELEIINPTDKKLRIKFTQACYNDAENISELISSGKCFSVSHTLIRNYVQFNTINFRFRMIKREIEHPIKSLSSSNSKTANKSSTKAHTKQSENRNFEMSNNKRQISTPHQNETNFGMRIGASFNLRGNDNSNFRNKNK